MDTRVAYIATGGTISCVGTDPHDLLDYTNTGVHLNAAQLLAHMGDLGDPIAIEAVDFRAVDSTRITPRDWSELADLCVELASCDRNYAGIVISHGTASLEETAFALSMVLDLDIPVVVTGAMRPSSGMSSDGNRNLASSFRAAASDELHGCGVVVLLNDEVHAAATATKTHSLSVATFQSPDFGPIAQMVGNRVMMRGAIVAKTKTFPTDCLMDFPRIDVTYSYAGADGAAVQAFVDAGARGIVAAGFAPGMMTPAEVAALHRAATQGVIIVIAHRVPGGPAIETTANTRKGFIPAGRYSALKARILLGLGIASSAGQEDIRKMFE